MGLRGKLTSTDAMVVKSNQRHLGTIRSAAAAIGHTHYVHHSSSTSYHSGSLVLPAFFQKNAPQELFSFPKLHNATKRLVVDLNTMMDQHQARTDGVLPDLSQRPINIGIQGLADVLMSMQVAFDSREAMIFNIRVFSAVYYAALESSCELAITHGPYKNWQDSPVGQGLLQFDLWSQEASDGCDWDGIKARIHEHGLRNAVLISPSTTVGPSLFGIHNKTLSPYARYDSKRY